MEDAVIKSKNDVHKIKRTEELARKDIKTVYAKCDELQSNIFS